jgi:hypothetical protein
MGEKTEQKQTKKTKIRTATAKYAKYAKKGCYNDWPEGFQDLKIRHLPILA